MRGLGSSFSTESAARILSGRCVSETGMAVAVASEDAETFMKYAAEENLEATIVATVTEEKRMREVWNGKTIVDLSREFLNSNGAERHALSLIHLSGPFHQRCRHRRGIDIALW